MEENKPMIKKSIFRQQTFAKRYELTTETEEIDWYYEGKFHRVNKYIDTQKIKYVLGKELIEDKEIFTCDLILPLLRNGEQFYIEELELLVTIKSNCRTSSEEVCYYVEPKIINDEMTEKTLNEVKEILGEKLQSIVLDVRRLKHIKNELDKIKSSFWYKIINKVF